MFTKKIQLIAKLISFSLGDHSNKKTLSKADKPFKCNVDSFMPWCQLHYCYGMHVHVIHAILPNVNGSKSKLSIYLCPFLCPSPYIIFSPHIKVKYTVRHNIKTTCLILCIPLVPSKTALTLWSCPAASGKKRLAEDPINPVNCEVGPPWIELAHPTD